MGLFDKKMCCICGSKAGMLTRQKIKDDYICGDCRGKCSPQMTWRQFEAMSPADVKAHMEYVVHNEENYKNFFNETYTINSGILGRTPVVSVDENNGWWVPAGTAKPDILTFDQVITTRLELDTRRLTDEERQKPNRARMPMPPYGMPGCASDEEITSMKMIVQVNHPWISEVTLTVMNALMVTEGDIRAGYECARQIMDYFNRKAATVRTAQAAQPKNSGSDPAEMIRKFKELLDMGAITQEEFDAKKKQLLNL